MRPEKIVSTLAPEPWQATCSAAETAVLTRDEAKALADLAQLAAMLARMLAPPAAV